MKITVKKGEKILISREDVISIIDKVGAYEMMYEGGIGQLVYKDEGIEIVLD